jgi:hypothetical protein
MGLGVLWLAAVPPLLAAESKDATSDKSPPVVRDAQALADRIDQILSASWKEKGVKPAALADDAEFLRRLYLDLAGRIPDVQEVRKFLDDKSADKRQRMVEMLLSERSALYVSHFTNVWRSLMVPQTNNQQLQGLAQGLDNWLKIQLRDNVGYDQLVRDVLTTPVSFTRGANPQQFNQPSPRVFYQANENRPENLAAATSRLFLGVKLECAQCHDHPFAKWSRKQFWEYAAFFAGVQGQGPNPAFGQVQEKPDLREIGIPGTDKKVEARFLDGKDPEWQGGGSARATLAQWMTRPDNPFFARAAVNRMWAHFFGTGIIDPVDEPSDDNPPSHPELLDVMAKQFADHKFDLKFLIRAITYSKVYQLSSKLSDESQDDPRTFSRMALKGLTAEQLFDSLAEATRYRETFQGNQRQFGFNTARAEFLNKFANHSDKRTEYQTSILQALSLMNGKFIEDATSVERSGTLAAVIDSPFFDTPEKQIETLFLSSLSRKPRPEEMVRFVKYVNSGGPTGDSKKALADVFWALLNSTEFILNH